LHRRPEMRSLDLGMVGMGDIYGTGTEEVLASPVSANLGSEGGKEGVRTVSGQVRQDSY